MITQAYSHFAALKVLKTILGDVWSAEFKNSIVFAHLTLVLGYGITTL